MADEIIEDDEVEEPAEDAENFPKAYVEKLRRENAEARTALNEYEEVFGDEQGQTWKQAAALWREDPETVAKWMQENAQPFLSSDDGDDVQPDPDGEPVPYVTQEQLQEMLSQRDDDFQQSQALAELDRHAENLGYEPDSPDYVELLWFANNKTEGDLDKADELVNERRQEMLSALIDATNEDNEDSATLPPAGGGVPSGEKKITNWKEAKASAEARIANAV